MKEMSARKIVLGSIALLACVVLLLSLGFSIYKIGITDEFKLTYDEEDLAKLTIKETGFNLLDFDSDFNNLQMLYSKKYSNSILSHFDWLVTLCGALSLSILICAICGIVLTTCGTLFFSQKKSNNVNKLFVILALVFSVLYLAVGITTIVYGKFVFKKVLSDTELTSLKALLKVSTATFWSVIFQVVFLVGYAICSKEIVDRTKLCEILNADENSKKTGKKSHSSACKFLANENAKIDLLIRYHGLFTDGMITENDYEVLKKRLLNL